MSDRRYFDKSRRRATLRRLAARAMPGGEYVVIYADPPWRFQNWSEKGMDRNPANHYATMDLADIQALKIPAAADAVLFLWATAPLLPAAIATMAAWGFTYKSFIAWDKEVTGTGYWVRSRVELLLIGTRGRPPAPLPSAKFPGLIRQRRTRHSEKPGAVYTMIETTYPDVPRLELFARQERPGWTAWGNEIST